MKNFIVLLLTAAICSGCMTDNRFRKKFLSDLVVDLNSNDDSIVLDEAEPKRTVNIGLLYVDF